MAFRRALAHRLFNKTKISTTQTLPSPNAFFRKFLNPPDDSGFFRRLLQNRAIFQSAVPPECLSLPVGDKLIERLRGLNGGDRLRLEGLIHPTPGPDPADPISVEDARKLLRISQLEALKSSLKQIPKNCISYSEFMQICADRLRGTSPDQVSELVKMLDQSGVVIVLGNVVFLHPEQVVKAIESVIPLSMAHPNDPRREELAKMEKLKVEIDMKAESLVRRELWGGLCFLVLQTAAFMRLTFWELSWDVMEPICFYFTSVYFMAGYAFFLRTSKDPSFEGLFESRFSTKQRRLMKLKNFDITRFNELRKALDQPEFSPLPSCSSPRRTLLGAMH
ncbi:calcium uniporter protein 2, mitochondrial-like [Magnolia sinica]|uniref:calcium uniporter protein 2, mitochondrial-like n=1 Tax=Magnolia sinica TaxID=86752 RepID=UPI0026598165|nr:calcium uniporter protein 2, mitochondrial-like [Magnolia sinica]